jgi:acetolactate synthase-1/2/3 large subunit
MKISDFIVKHLVEKYSVTTAFTITGGGAMYLNNAFASEKKLNCVYMHHEQSLAMASEAYSRVSQSLAVCQVTTGPGGTNAISGCAGAWIDSEPILFISGQVEGFSRMRNTERQSGVQEVNIVALVDSITKLAIELKDPYQVRYELERLVHTALSGRKGPVWLDIPLEIQNFDIGDPETLASYRPLNEDSRIKQIEKGKFLKALKCIENSTRPVICIGGGCSGLSEELEKLIEKLQVPVILGWNGKDLVGDSNEYLMGSAGLFGNRSANILISQADLIVGIGYRFSIPQVGYNPFEYTKNKVVISVDIDNSELSKMESFLDMPIKGNSKDFIEYLLDHSNRNEKCDGWRLWARYLKNFGFDSNVRDKIKINSFDFTDLLKKTIKDTDVVITDMGTSFTCTHQTLELPRGAKLLTSSGLAAMGFGLPGAVGAHFANSSGRTILISGDGGIMFNIQELQTVKTYGLNIKIIIYENGGYLTMKHMQKARFGKLVGSDAGSNVNCPDFLKVFQAFGISVKSIYSYKEIEEGLQWLFSKDDEPLGLIVHLDPWQDLTPRVQTQSDAEGRLFPATLDSMYPFLNSDIKEKLNEKSNQYIGIRCL